MLTEVAQCLSLIGGAFHNLSMTEAFQVFAKHRYRMVPTFGRGTIRAFHKNASAMKRLAARDFEDLLQVCVIQIMMGNSKKMKLHYSALCRSSRDFSPLLIMRSYLIFFSTWLHGIHLPSFGFIQMTLYSCLTLQHASLAIRFEIFKG